MGFVVISDPNNSTYYNTYLGHLICLYRANTKTFSHALCTDVRNACVSTSSIAKQPIFEKTNVSFFRIFLSGG